MINKTINEKSAEQAKNLNDLQITLNLDIKKISLRSAEELNASLV